MSLDKTEIRRAECAKAGKDRIQLSRADPEPTGECGCVLHRARGRNPSAIRVEIVRTPEGKRGIRAVKLGPLNRTTQNDVVAAPTMIAAAVRIRLEGP